MQRGTIIWSPPMVKCISISKCCGSRFRGARIVTARTAVGFSPRPVFRFCRSVHSAKIVCLGGPPAVAFSSNLPGSYSLGAPPLPVHQRRERSLEILVEGGSNTYHTQKKKRTFRSSSFPGDSFDPLGDGQTPDFSGFFSRIYAVTYLWIIGCDVVTCLGMRCAQTVTKEHLPLSVVDSLASAGAASPTLLALVRPRCAVLLRRWLRSGRPRAAARRRPLSQHLRACGHAATRPAAVGRGALPASPPVDHPPSPSPPAGPWPPRVCGGATVGSGVWCARTAVTAAARERASAGDGRLGSSHCGWTWLPSHPLPPPPSSSLRASLPASIPS